MLTLFSIVLSVVYIAVQQAIITHLFGNILNKYIVRLTVSALFINAVYIALSLISEPYGAVQVAVSCAMLFLSYKFIFRNPIDLSIAMSLCHMILSFVFEYIVIVSLVVLGRQELLNDAVGLIVLRLIYVGPLLAVYFLVRYKKITFLHTINQYDAKGVWIAYLSFFFLVILPFMIDLEKNDKAITTATGAYLLLVFVAFIVFNIVYIRNYFQMSAAKQKLEMQTLYASTLEDSLNDLRMFKHNFANLISSINGYVKANNHVALERYVDSISTEFLKINTYDIINDSLKDHPAIYGLILSKMAYAETHGIAFSVSIQCQIELHYCSSLDFSIMIGILLDNALQAASECAQKYVEFEIISRWELYFITVINRVEQPVNLDRVFEEGYSTKKDHTGLGLNQLRAIIKKYQNKGYDMSLKTESADGLFVQELRI